MLKIFILVGVICGETDTCTKKGDCEKEEDFGDSIENAAVTKKFIPFRYTSKSRYIDDFDKFIAAYGKWQSALLENPNLDCKGSDEIDYQGVIFQPNAGLGDSANALAAAFLYTVNTGRMFFINWKPWDWSDGFSNPGFPVNYKTLTAEKKVCKGGAHGNLIELSGHITANHPLAQAKKLNRDINFSAVRFFQHFFAPSQPVKQILSKYENIVTENTVAVVIRTGWDDWQQFLLEKDPLKFPICLKGWKDAGGLPEKINVLVTSDREDVKKETVKKLEEFGFDVIYLDGSYTHVSTPESIAKVHKTIAEFHLLSMTGYGLLTSSSLFGRTAVSELGGKSMHGKFHMLSAADCDRQHKGYYRCAEPKYPRFCPTGDKSHEW